MNDHRLHGIAQSDISLSERKQYLRVADQLCAALERLLTRDQLQDLRAELLVLLIQLRRDQVPPHLHALLKRLLTAVHEAADCRRA